MENYPVFMIRKLILLKYPHYLKSSIDSMQSLSKFQGHFFYRSRKINLNIHM